MASRSSQDGLSSKLSCNPAGRFIGVSHRQARTRRSPGKARARCSGSIAHNIYYGKSEGDVTLAIERAQCAILPSQRMMALVSGMSKENRENRLFMVAVYQCFVDDSDAGAGGPFVLAGFVSSVETWARFADDWRAKLFNAKPR